MQKHERAAAYELNKLLAVHGLRAAEHRTSRNHHKFLIEDAAGHVHHVAVATSPSSADDEVRNVVQRARRLIAQDHFVRPEPPTGRVLVTETSITPILPGITTVPDSTVRLRTGEVFLTGTIPSPVEEVGSETDAPAEDPATMKTPAPTKRQQPHTIVKLTFTNRLMIHDRLRAVLRVVGPQEVEYPDGVTDQTIADEFVATFPCTANNVAGLRKEVFGHLVRHPSGSSISPETTQRLERVERLLAALLVRLGTTEQELLS